MEFALNFYIQLLNKAELGQMQERLYILLQEV